MDEDIFKYYKEMFGSDDFDQNNVDEDEKETDSRIPDDEIREEGQDEIPNENGDMEDGKEPDFPPEGKDDGSTTPLVEEILKSNGINVSDVPEELLEAMTQIEAKAKTEAPNGELDTATAQELLSRFVEASGGDIERAVELMNEYIQQYGEQAVANAVNGDEVDQPQPVGEPEEQDRVPPKPETGQTSTGIKSSPSDKISDAGGGGGKGSGGGGGPSQPGQKALKAGQPEIPTGSPKAKKSNKKMAKSAGAQEEEDEE